LKPDNLDKSKFKTVYICQQCGKESLKWLGRCPYCQEWNSFVETAIKVATPLSSWLPSAENAPQELSQIKTEAAPRFTVPLAEFNRVLGGGLVPGSLVLVGGDPGIGKSTLLLQVSSLTADKETRVVYVSGEESPHQIKLRAERLGIKGGRLYLLPETNVEAILARLEELQPKLVVVDSIQTVHSEDLAGAPGSLTQIRECTLRLMRWAKKADVPVLITGHVTKDGAIAGPRVLEHIVDAVMYLEGESFSPYRVLRSVKNRFGSTNEVGVFEMRSEGLIEVDNPSQAFLSRHPEVAIGSAVVPTLEGSRPLLVEIQALTTPVGFGPPRRIANGVDFGRLLLVTAVLTRRAGLNLSNQDIMINVTGGLRIGEPAADLGMALAIASSFRDTSIKGRTTVLGEIGLSGEIRAVPQLERRLAEAERLGFNRSLVPKVFHKPVSQALNIELIPVTAVAEALRLGLNWKRKGATK